MPAPLLVDSMRVNFLESMPGGFFVDFGAPQWMWRDEVLTLHRRLGVPPADATSSAAIARAEWSAAYWADLLDLKPTYMSGAALWAAAERAKAFAKHLGENAALTRMPVDPDELDAVEAAADAYEFERDEERLDGLDCGLTDAYLFEFKYTGTD